MQKTLFIFLGLVVFTSGCLEGFGFDGLFGSTGSETVTGQNDILVVKNSQVIPTGAVPAGSVFEVNFQVQNTGGAETGKEATGVNVTGFDWGRCSPADASMVSGSQLTGIPNQPVTIFPGGGTRLVEWEFRAPTNQELGGVKGVCPIRFKVNYDFNAFTVRDFVVISEDRLRELNRAGQTSSVSGGQSRGEGPIKMDIQIDAPQPIRTGSVVPVRITISDEGQGLYREVPNGSLSLKFPEGMSVTCDDRITVTGSTATNNQPIQLIRKVSPPIRCNVAAPSSNVVTDIRTYSIQAQLDYTYTLFDEIDVAIKPTFEGAGSSTGGSGAGAPAGFEGSGGPDGDSGSSSAPTGFEGSGGPE